MSIVPSQGRDAVTTPDTRVADYASWERSASAVFVPLAVQPLQAADFRGRLVGLAAPDATAVRVDAEAHRITRTQELVAEGGGGFFKFGLQLAGHGLLVQDGREAVLRPGDVSVYDTSRPYSLTFESQASTLVVMVSHERLGHAAPDVAELVATRLGEDGLADVVVPVLAGLAQRLPTREVATGRLLVRHAVDLLQTLCDDDARRRLGGRAQVCRGERRVQLRRVMEYIDERLGDADLSPQAIAEAHFISVRSLYKLFEDSGTTVAGFLRSRRLARAEAELTDPGLRELPVGRIAARCGLPDPAHFSRLFRAAYGVAPTQLRRATR